MPRASINGSALHYLDQGRGLPLVLLHGFPLDSRIWDAQTSALCSDFRVIAPDLPGFGQSPSTSPFTIESLADTVHALLASIGALPCALAGLSMGGYIALAFAKKFSPGLKALALIDTRSQGDTPEARTGREKSIQTVREKGPAAIAAAMLPKLIMPGLEQSRPQLALALRSMMESCPALTIEHALLALRDRLDYSPILPSIAPPTLIIVGDSDAITPPDVSRSMHDAIPNSRLVVVRAAGHMSPMEQPEQVNQALRTFLAGIV